MDRVKTGMHGPAVQELKRGEKMLKEHITQSIAAHASQLEQQLDKVDRTDAPGFLTFDRAARVERKTKETDVCVELNLDGTGKTCIDTGVPFFDHMLDSFGRHGLFDLNVRSKGDIEIDAHHTVEDTGIVLGTAFLQALGTKEGINRFGNFTLAMDEALVLAALDFSGRGGCWASLNIPAEQVGNFDTELGVEFFKAFASNANLTLHVRQLAGENSHHILEAAFKAVARALRQACEIDPRILGVVPSTKGSL